jgi:hypothetical protein
LDKLSEDETTGFAWKCVADTFRDCYGLKQLKEELFEYRLNHFKKGKVPEYFTCVEEYMDSTCNSLVEE